MPDRFALPLRALTLGTLVLIAACGGDAAGPEQRAPGSIAASGALESTGTVGAALGGAPAVLVLDTRGRALPGVQVGFQVSAGGGSVSSPVATTDALGVASAGSWTLGTRPGANVLEARVGGLPAVRFEAVAAVGQAASVLPDPGNPASAVAGQFLDPAPAVLVLDGFGNPVPGVSVAFTAGTGSGTLSGAVAVATDSAGRARPGRWTLGTTAGPQTLLASAAGGLNAALVVAVRAAAPAELAVHAGAGQTGTVGKALAVSPAVRVRDAWGNPVEGVAVAFAVSAGGGSLAAATASTGADGVATAGAWTLGTKTGANAVTATVAGLVPVTLDATATAGAAAKLEKLEGDDQRVTAGATLPVRPAVRVLDAYDNPAAGAGVTFTPSAGTVTGGSLTVGADGIARVGGWTLGPTPGTQTLTANAGPVTVSFTATALPGVPSVLQVAAGGTQSAPAGTAVPTRPAVRVLDAAGLPVQGVPVSFAVTAGGGTVSGAAALTGADGVATVGGWTLGTVAGTNRLTGTVAGLGAVTFTATGTVGPAARVEKAAGDGQAAAIGTTVAVPPTVRVTDAYGNAVGGAPVTFTVSAGGGSVSGATTQTGATGLASVGSWVLGSTVGVNTLTATVPGVGNVTFTAQAVNATPTSQFHIDVRFVAPVAALYQQAFAEAVARWQNVIVVDLPATSVNAAAGTCGNNPAVSEIVDDLVIYVELKEIDGVGQVLGQAGPCYLRNSSLLPVLGMMKFDTADLERMHQNGTLATVIQHEIGHVLGIGTVWTQHSLLQGAGTDDPFYSGPAGMSRFTLAGGIIAAGNGVPVENTGNSGTRDSHWRESTLRNELMTGWISSGTNPLSAITIGSLADLGYGVNFLAADPFTVTLGDGGAYLLDPGEQLRELAPPIVRVLR